MNRIYRIVWNATINRWVVASEVAKGRKKQSAGEARPSGQAAVMFAATLMVAGAAWTPQPAHAFFTKCNLIWGACPKVVVPVSPAPAPAPDASYDWASSTHKYFRANDTGSAAEPLGGGSVAIGGNSRARDWYTLAAGNNAKGSGYSAVAVGGWSHAAGSSAVAVGNTASAKQEHAIAVGGYSRAESKDAVALGSHSSALAEGALSVGSGSSSNVAFGSALGTGARVVSGADGAVALGAYSVADRDNTVSVGDAKGDKRQVVNVGAGTEGFDAVNVTRITNVADGIEDTDAANLGMVREISQNTLEGNNNALRLMAFSDSAPPVARMQVVPMAAVETAAVTPSDGSGAESADRGRYKILENGNWYLQVAGRVDGVGRTGPTDSAFTGNNAGVIAIGSDSGTTAENAIAFGTLSRATARDAVAIGTGSVADQENTVSVGSATDHSYEALAPDRASRVTLTTKANARRVVNMAAGQAETDAVNVGQLSQVTATLGGGAAVQQDGSVKGPTYSVGGNTYTNVGDALAAVNAAAATGSPLGIVYDDATRSKVSFQGQGGTTLSNVKAGTADTDAVNVSQLKASGLVDGSGNAATAVVYDDASRSSVTLGGKDATSPVRLGNVADAQADTDAVNLKQLRSAGLVDGDGATLDAVVYDSDSSKGRVTFGGANGTVLNNVADGRIATGSREAVNGGQIAALRDSLNSSISGLDTRVTTLEKTPPISGDGALNPLVNVQGPGSDANAGPAVEGSVAVGADTRAQTSGSVAIGKGAQVTADAANSVALGQGSVADRSNSLSVGAPGSERVVANVADGVRDTDVATVRQMNQAQTSAKEYTDTRIKDAWNTITRDMDDMNRQVIRSTARAWPACMNGTSSSCCPTAAEARCRASTRCFSTTPCSRVTSIGIRKPARSG